MEIADDNAGAVEELLEAASEQALGLPPLLLAGVPVTAVITDATLDQILGVGGNSERGGFSAVVRKTDFPDGPPAKGVVAQARGLTVQVMQTDPGIAHYVIFCADPIAR